MRSVLLSMIAALFVTAMATPLVRKLALRLRAVDQPTARRVNARQVPRLGGIALVLGFFLAQLLLFACDTEVAKLLFGQPFVVVGMVVGSGILMVLGILDDTRGLSAKTKLLVQSVAALVAYAAGFQIHSLYLPGIGVVSLGIFALPATWLWITAVVNALNLIDGLDGLAAGVAFFVCVTNFVIAWMGGNVLICLFSATLAGALLGFLIYNFNPATIFMGDSGSMFLGFVLATTSLHGAGSYKSTTAIAVVVPIMALGVPILDMLVAMARRFLARRSIFSPDRGHIHHRLLDAGLTHRRAVLILYGLCVAFTAGALAIALGRSWQVGVALTVLTVVTVGVTRFVGYFNQGLAKAGKRYVRGPDVERLRHLTPVFISEASRASRRGDVQELLLRFAADAEMLSVTLDQPAFEDQGWNWQSKDATPKTRSEAVNVSFQLRADDGLLVTLCFSWDCAEGEVSPQSEIMLQLVSDAIEQALARTAEVRHSPDLAAASSHDLRFATQR